jgi:hypothetical protein
MFGDFGDQCDVFESGEAGDEVVELEDEADMLAAEAGEAGITGCGEVVIEIVDFAAGGTSRPPRMFSKVDFPLPEGPRMTTSSPV